jgi:hypothetical protein
VRQKVTNNSSEKIIFLTWVYSARQKNIVQFLIDNLRAFGGSLGQCPVWVFEANPQTISCKDLQSESVQVLPLETPNSVKRYFYADKVYACAQAESFAPPEIQSLVWLTPECLLIQPPTLFDLALEFDAAVRPVHIKNVGLLAAEPVDEFWKQVYEIAGVDEIHTTVESFVDRQHIRSYYNSAAFAVNPSTGLFNRWFECFETLVCDQGFQDKACQDERHQIFLHQAILSTLLSTMLDPDRLHILPPEYVYPYNLHKDVPLERRATRMNDLVCIYYEGRTLDSGAIDDIEVQEPLRSWLSEHAREISG